MRNGLFFVKNQLCSHVRESPLSLNRSTLMMVTGSEEVFSAWGTALSIVQHPILIAPAGRRQHIFGHKEVRYAGNSYPSRS